MLVTGSRTKANSKYGRFIQELGIYLPYGHSDQYQYRLSTEWFYTLIDGKEKLVFTREEIETVKPLYSEKYHEFKGDAEPIVLSNGDKLYDNLFISTVTRVR